MESLHAAPFGFVWCVIGRALHNAAERSERRRDENAAHTADQGPALSRPDRSGLRLVDAPARWRRSVPVLASDAAVPERAASASSLEGRDHKLFRTLYTQVIPRVEQSRRPGAAGLSLAAPSPQEVSLLTTLILDGAEQGITALFERLRRRTVPAETIFVDLLAPVARRLGELWMDDRCGFATVTVGVARLQRLMREFSVDFALQAPLNEQPQSVLLAQPPDEQHGLGVAIVAEFFRRDGWAVEALVGPWSEDPARRVQADWFDVVGFSIGSETRLDWLRLRIDAVRLASRNAALVVLVGGPLFQANPVWADHVGADAWVLDGRQVPALARQCIDGAANPAQRQSRPTGAPVRTATALRNQSLLAPVG